MTATFKEVAGSQKSQHFFLHSMFLMFLVRQWSPPDVTQQTLVALQLHLLKCPSGFFFSRIFLITGLFSHGLPSFSVRYPFTEVSYTSQATVCDCVAFFTFYPQAYNSDCLSALRVFRRRKTIWKLFISSSKLALQWLGCRNCSLNQSVPPLSSRGRPHVHFGLSLNANSHCGYTHQDGA